MELIETLDPELKLLRLNKESGYKYRRRRQENWKENYTLYRDTVTINRLIQRQSVNVPLMKQSIKTLLKDVDDMTVLYFENRDNDKQAEVFQNEYWNIISIINKLEAQDIMDKKQVMLFGRSFMQQQIKDGKIIFTVQDPQHILVDRSTDPHDIDSARFLVHTNIYVPLSVIERNEMYDKNEVAKLKDYLLSREGIEKISENDEMAVEEAEKLSEMGLEDAQEPVLGETYIELGLHFVMRAEKASEEEQYYMYIEAENQAKLLKKPLEEVIGKTKDNFWQDHLPYTTWADDIEKQDFWSDAIADVIRTPNKVLNSWFSQLVENRTLKNFNMNFYDGSVSEEFAPQTFVPKPWGWYKLPGDPNKLLKQVPVADLGDSMDDMKFIMDMVERASGATVTQQGDVAERQITLGEVKLALGEAKERVRGMSKFYTPTWQERGLKFLKLIEAAHGDLDAVKIFKKGRNTDNIYERKISPSDWMTKEGYQVKVWSQDEKNARDSESLQILNAVMMNMPGNMKLLDNYQRKLLEFAKLPPDQVNEIMEEEKRKRQAMMGVGAGQPMITGQPMAGQTPMTATPPPVA